MQIRIQIKSGGDLFQAISEWIERSSAKEIPPDFSFQVNTHVHLEKVVGLREEPLPAGLYSSKICGHLDGGKVHFSERKAYLCGKQFSIKNAVVTEETNAFLYIISAKPLDSQNEHRPSTLICQPRIIKGAMTGISGATNGNKTYRF